MLSYKFKLVGGKEEHGGEQGLEIRVGKEKVGWMDHRVKLRHHVTIKRSKF